MAAFQLAAWPVMPIGMLIKHIVRRPRPLKAMLRTDAHRASGSSFPSTHVAMYTAYVLGASWLALLIALVRRSEAAEKEPSEPVVAEDGGTDVGRREEPESRPLVAV
jgi:hypothetical protein